jgi:hypothetical protein
MPKKPSHALRLNQQQRLPIMQSLSIGAPYDPSRDDPWVALRTAGIDRPISLESAFALANALYLAAGYAEADGFVLYFFDHVQSARMTAQLRGIVLAKLREARSWPPPMYDLGIAISYGFGGNTGVPFVTVTVDGEARQFTAESARTLAHGLLLAAEDARNNVQLLQAIKMEAGADLSLPPEIDGQLIMVLNHYREEIKRTQQEFDHPTVVSA